METYFFDSHGQLWMTCDAGVDGAVAFGPSGVAVQIDVVTRSGETPWSAAKRMGLVVPGEWDTLVDGGLNAGNGEDPACTFNPAASPAPSRFIMRAARLAVGGVYGSAGNCRVEIRQNRETHEVPNYDAPEIVVSIVSIDAEALGDDGAEESSACSSSEWRSALALAMQAWPSASVTVDWREFRT